MRRVIPVQRLRLLLLDVLILGMPVETACVEEED